MPDNLPAKKILIIAGEASGDMHGAELVKSLRAQHPDFQFYGIGGSAMQAAGVEILVESRELAVVGIIEVIAHLKTILRALKKIRLQLIENRPDLVILIDFPDFNLQVAKYAKQLNIKVLYYISPQIWAWRKGRIKTIKKRINRMAVVFPFEAELYQSHGVPVTFVGHPLVDRVSSQFSQAEARRFFNLNESAPTVGLLPGSRSGEIKHLLPIILESAQHIKQQIADVQFILPLASTITEDQISLYLSSFPLPLKIIPGHTYDAMQACDALITASGTVTLEAALMQIPHVIIYKMSPLSYFLASSLVNITHVGLANIIAKKSIVPELLQSAASPANIAAEIIKILQNPEYAMQQKQKLLSVKELLSSSKAEMDINKVAVEMLDLHV